eukprot:12420558-Prorocentrum_lima.AAC.1
MDMAGAMEDTASPSPDKRPWRDMEAPLWARELYGVVMSVKTEVAGLRDMVTERLGQHEITLDKH